MCISRERIKPSGNQIVILAALTLGASWSVADDQSSDQTLQEVTVTATRRSETLNKVPISINALDAAELQKSGVKDIQDISGLTPGVDFDRNSNYGAGLSNISIRGVSSVNGASTTGIYYGDLSLQTRVTPSSATGNPYPVSFDLDRVEVLRGPQGALFGAGAEGGAVRFIPVAPSLTKSSGFANAEFDVTDGGGVSYVTDGAFGGPISDGNAAFRLGGYYRSDGGYIDRIDPFTGAIVDRNANGSSTTAGRLAFAFKLGDSLQIKPEIYSQKLSVNDTGSFTYYRSDLATDSYNNARLLRQSSDDRLLIASLTVEDQLPFADLTSITGYFQRNTDSEVDVTNLTGLFDVYTHGSPGYGSPLGAAYPTSYADAAPAFSPGSLEVLSEEIRLVSSDSDARLHWVAGLYASHSKQSDSYLAQSALAVDTLANVFGATQSPAMAAVVAGQSRYYGVSPENTVYFVADPTSVDKQFALFGQLDVDITSRLKWTVGGRVSRVSYDYSVMSGGLGFTDATLPASLGASSQATPFTPTVSLSFQADENNLFYARAAKGYRLGIGNNPIPSYCGFNEPATAAADTLWSYEAGAKNRLFNGRLQLDSSIYQINWRGIQTLVLLPCGFTPLLNAGTARSRGFDVAARMRITEGVTANLAVAYTDAIYTKDIAVDGALIVRQGDVIGSSWSSAQVPTPWHLVAGVEKVLHLFSGVGGLLRVEDVFRSRNNGPFANQDPASASYTTNSRPNPSTNLLNARSTINWTHTSVSLFVDNVLNSQPDLGQFYDAGTSNFLVGSTFRPRTVGISITEQFQ